MSSRLDEINARLKVICPHNDQDQFEIEWRTVSRDCKVCVYGMNYKEKRIWFLTEIYSLTAERDRQMNTLLHEGILLTGEDMPMSYFPLTLDEKLAKIHQHYSELLRDKIKTVQLSLGTLQKKISDMNAEYADREQRIARMECQRMGFDTAEERKNMILGVPEHRKEVAALKEERRRLTE